MLRKIMGVSGIIVFLFTPCISNFGQAQTQVDDSTKTIVPKEMASKSGPTVSDVSSPIVITSTSVPPAPLTGVATFGMMGTCCSNETTPKPITCSDNKSITWYNYTTPPSVTNFNLLTIIFSSVPPLPAQWSLAGVTQTVANTTVVLDRTTCSACFTGTAPTSITLSQIVNWNTASYSCPLPTDLSKAYPAQTWSIGPVVLIYQ